MKENVAKRDWFRIFSPAVLGIVFSIIAIIISYVDFESSGGWSFLGVIMLAPVFGILLILDLIIKLILKEKTLIIWLVELLTLGLIYIFWISKFADRKTNAQQWVLCKCGLSVNTTQTDPLPPFQIDPSKTGAGICLF